MATDPASAYCAPHHDDVRGVFEEGFFARVVPALLNYSGGGALLDLGCADGLAGRLGGPGLTRYLGVDFRAPEPGLERAHLRHDLRGGLGDVGSAPFDVYLATFGVVSHLRPTQLRRLLEEIAAHARPGSIVALEALGKHSLEWPHLWRTRPGPGRSLPYRLGSEVEVHPWCPGELARMYADAGIRPLRALDRSVQAGPKAGEGRYWPGLPPLRRALDSLLAGGPEDVLDGARATLAAPLGPLPAGPAASFHHALADRRRALIDAHRADGTALARSIWALEPRSGGGFGHGLLLVGRVT